MTTLEDPPQFETSFDVVRDKQHINVEGKQPVRFQINRKILYLRMIADGIEDRQNAVREKKENKTKKEKIDTDARINIPLKGASIWEVKFYGSLENWQTHNCRHIVRSYWFFRLCFTPKFSRHGTSTLSSNVWN